MKMKKILFLHGFFASGSCELALTLKKEFDGRAEVISPDLPHHPTDALCLIHDICDREKPDLLVGNSCGSFFAQILAPVVGIPALLGNPHLEMTKFLEERIGVHQYKSPRADGKMDFVIDRDLIEEFAKEQRCQFDCYSPYYSDKVWGLFGEQDTLAHYEPLFLQYYTRSFHFLGGHTPSAEDVRKWYVPLIEKMLQTYNVREDGSRCFVHFKGGHYRFVHTAFDSETKERMVVYQALYGEKSYWVRPEKMFFGHVTRNGKMFNRFLETDNI